MFSGGGVRGWSCADDVMVWVTVYVWSLNARMRMVNVELYSWVIGDVSTLIDVLYAWSTLVFVS